MTNTLVAMDAIPNDAYVGEKELTVGAALNWLAENKVYQASISLVMPAHYQVALILADMVLAGHHNAPGRIIESWTGDPDTDEDADIIGVAWAPDDEALTATWNAASEKLHSGIIEAREGLIESYRQRAISDPNQDAWLTKSLMTFGLILAYRESEVA